MISVFPSKEWFEEIIRTANASAELKYFGKYLEWGFLCTVIIDEGAVEDLKRESFFRNFLSMLSMIPKEDRVLFKDRPLGNFFERIVGIPLGADLENLNVKDVFEKIFEVNLDYLKGTSINLWIDYYRGRVRSFTPVAPGQHEDAPFKISGPYSAWEKAGAGEMNIPDLIVKGDLKFTGDITPIMGRLEGFNALLRVFSSVALNFRCQHCGYIDNTAKFKRVDTKLYGQLLQCPKCWKRTPT